MGGERDRERNKDAREKRERKSEAMEKRQIESIQVVIVLLGHFAVGLAPDAPKLRGKGDRRREVPERGRQRQ